MKFKIYLLAIAIAAIEAAPAFPFSWSKGGGETLVMVPARSSALIIIENGSRFDPLVQRLLAEGEIKRLIIFNQPLLQFPPSDGEGYLNELQLRYLEELLRR